MGRRLQDLIGPAKRFDLALELTHPGPLIGRQPRPLTGVGLGPTDPLTQRLVVDRQLRRDRLDRLPTATDTRPGARTPSAPLAPAPPADTAADPSSSALTSAHPLNETSSQ